jgi:hypothetical protein
MNVLHLHKLTSLAVTAGSLLLLSLSSTALAAANGSKEVQTAIEHAGFASKSKTTNEVHLHLHHVINCLVGPKGEGYDIAAGDPCKGEGGGALNDLKDMPQQKYLQQALNLAKTGVNISHRAPARNVATAVDDLLKEAQGSMHSKKETKGYQNKS